MISLSGGFYVTVTFQSAISQIITRVQPPAPIVGIILILIPTIADFTRVKCDTITPPSPLIKGGTA